MTFIDVVEVSKSYGPTRVLDGVSLGVDRHQVACLIGPSGCGKSTLLRCINGLEKIQSGSIRVGTTLVSEELVDLNRLRSKVAIVFQQFNLFPHMTALSNVALGPRRVLGTPKAQAMEEARVLLGRVGLSAQVDKHPDALSGGQQQRVAIARALAMRPDALLLDEITSALDPERVGEVLDIVRELADDGMTMILATHEMEFARDVGTSVHFMQDGDIYEQGTPEEVFGNPQLPKTQAFLSRMARGGHRAA